MKRLNLKAERVRSGYTVKEISSLIGVHHETYYKYENGCYNIPLERVKKIAKVLNCNLDTLFPISENEQ